MSGKLLPAGEPPRTTGAERRDYGPVLRHTAWWTIESDDKRSSRLNSISHLLSQIPYKKVQPPKVKLPDRPAADDYDRPARELYKYVPDHASELNGD